MGNEAILYDFEWDDKKAKQNIKKHKVDFNRAAQVFLDQNAVSVFDKEHGGIEERWITIGMDKTMNLIIVCHTFNQLDKKTFRIRIISARKPTKTEIKQYEEFL